MNTRQRKKKARIVNDYYYRKKHPWGLFSTDCPNCGWDALKDDEYKYHKTLSERHGHPEYYGYISWDFEVKCKYCGTIFEYSDSNM